ncbi:MAG: hypothetical protein GW778_06750 [Alphaproteobacteria bacterium]|nr:hypothetical protein [Alphaproteobacteria bacterium]
MSYKNVPSNLNAHIALPNITLDWHKTPTMKALFESKQNDKEVDLEHLKTRGVYISVYSVDAFSRPGYYAGTTGNIYNRTLHHARNIMAGNSFIPHEKNARFDVAEYKRNDNISDFANDAMFERLKKVMFSSYIFYALCDDMQICNGIERALIKHIKDGESDNGYFSGNRGFRGCRNCPHELLITNEGHNEIIDLLGAKLAFSPP